MESEIQNQNSAPQQAVPEGTAVEPPKSGRSQIWPFIADFLKVFLIALAIIVPVRWFLFQPFVVTGDSMKPNFHDGDYLIIDEITYRIRPPGRGEVIVMRFPNDPSQFFIKRIVGLPGERVVIENGRVTIYDSKNPKGIVLNESYLPNNNVTYGNIDVTLDGQDFFVLGDNRLSSSDSRIWGALPRKDIVGRVYVRALPLPDFKLFANQNYNFSTP
ncbi:signal peptidase I [bacterium]|nr:MAG: signal peptidase I [bacterium]